MLANISEPFFPFFCLRNKWGKGKNSAKKHTCMCKCIQCTEKPMEMIAMHANSNFDGLLQNNVHVHVRYELLHLQCRLKNFSLSTFPSYTCTCRVFMKLKFSMLKQTLTVLKLCLIHRF